MKDRGTIKCKKCNSEIKWVKMIYNHVSAGTFRVTAISKDERVVNKQGIVYCNVCDEANEIE